MSRVLNVLALSATKVGECVCVCVGGGGGGGGVGRT